MSYIKYNDYNVSVCQRMCSLWQTAFNCMALTTPQYTYHVTSQPG